MKLYKWINKVEVKDEKGKPVINTKTGEVQTKSYTNFYLEMKIGDQLVKVAIAPKNFGNKLNKQGYAILSASAELLEEMPF